MEFYTFEKILIELKDAHIFSAAALKIKDKKTHFSYTDALGYSIAEAEGLKFVTGGNETSSGTFPTLSLSGDNLAFVLPL